MGALDTWSDIYVWMGTEKYHWKMKDKPHEIAKKFGFRRFDQIWLDDANRKLKVSRKKPENIKKGDVLVVPPTSSERAKIRTKIVTDSKAAIDYHRNLAKNQNGIASKFDDASKTLSKHLKTQQSEYQDAGYLLSKEFKAMKKRADGVDLAKDIIDLKRGLFRLVKDAKKSTKLFGNKLKEHNKKIADEAAQMTAKSSKMLGDTIKSQVQPELDKAVNYKGMRGEDRALSKVGSEVLKWGGEAKKIVETVNKTYDLIQTPSFWAKVEVSLNEGKSWSDAVTRDFDDELKQMRIRHKNVLISSMAHTSERKNWVESQAKKFRKQATESLQLVANYEKNLKEYQKL